MISRRKAARWCLVAILTLVVGVGTLSLMGFFAWSPLNCWDYDVDIHSGRIRYTRYLLYMRLRHTVEPSVLTAALQPEDYANLQPDWRSVHTFSPGVRNSPHYVYHGALAQIRELELCWNVGKFTAPARRASALHLLKCWQEGGGDDAARPYLFALSEVASQAVAAQRDIGLADLPTAGTGR